MYLLISEVVMQFLTNTVFLGLIIAALGILTSVLVPYIIHLRERNIKEISYVVFDNVPILSIKKEVKDSFEVRYNGYPVRDVTFLSIRIWNSGNVPIEEADVVDPIKLDFGEKATVIFCSTYTEHGNTVYWDNNGNLGGEGYLIFKPRLLNKGYGISVSVMVTGFRGYVTASGLIKGVHSIKKVRYTPKSNLPLDRLLFYSIFALVISLAVSLVAMLTSFGLKLFIGSDGNLLDTLQWAGFFLLFSAFFSGLIAHEIYSRMKTATRNSQVDDDFIKNLFALAQIKMEADLEAMKSQPANTSSRHTSQQKTSKPTQ